MYTCDIYKASSHFDSSNRKIDDDGEVIGADIAANGAAMNQNVRRVKDVIDWNAEKSVIARPARLKPEMLHAVFETRVF